MTQTPPHIAECLSSGCRCLVWTPWNGEAKSRKEVIQPHLPIRLPCYDFTPVMNHSVASVLLAVGLPASGATHSHGVTGGVYKARERIHRSNADLRLRSEEHTSELQSLMRISYAVFCLKKKKEQKQKTEELSYK